MAWWWSKSRKAKEALKAKRKETRADEAELKKADEAKVWFRLFARRPAKPQMVELSAEESAQLQKFYVFAQLPITEARGAAPIMADSLEEAIKEFSERTFTKTFTKTDETLQKRGHDWPIYYEGAQKWVVLHGKDGIETMTDLLQEAGFLK